MTRFSQDHLASSGELSSFQASVDGLVSHFADEAGDWRNLAAMATGSLFYRFGRVGTLALAARAQQAAPLLRIASYGVGLAAEVTAFQGASDFLSPQASHASQQTYFERWRTSFVHFALLKMGGAAAQGQNVLLQHGLQDFAMVAGHGLTGRMGWTPVPEGSLAEQLVHAEVTNLQLGAGMSLMHSVAPGLAALERNIDLSIRAEETVASEGARPTIFGPHSFGPVPAVETNAHSSNESGLTESVRDFIQRPTLIFSEMNGESGGGRRGNAPVALPKILEENEAIGIPCWNMKPTPS
ncbi:MAG: hypothetical protein U1F57_08720 [bacterium]